MELKRTYYKLEKFARTYGQSAREDRTVCPEADANLISSELQTPGDYHAPCLDIDFEARLVPSKTEGHHHLYLEQVMDWGTYSTFLKACAAAGVIEQGYCDISLKHHGTFLRTDTPCSAEGLLLERAVKAEHRVRELEVELDAMRDLLETVMRKK